MYLFTHIFIYNIGTSTLSLSHSAHALSSPSAHDWRIKQRSNQPVTRLSERNRRLAGVVAAYGKSLGLNVTKKRPASAKVSTGQSTYYSKQLKDHITCHVN